MYTVIGGVSSRTFRVLWALEELGLTYDHIASPPQSPDVTKLNPLGKIPVLMDGATALTDSVAIMTYLADKHGGLTAPGGTRERAQQDAMTMWLIDEFDAALWLTAKHGFVLPEDQRLPEIKPFIRKEFARQLDIFETKIQGDFVMGDTLTVPDILAVHCLNWAIGAKFPLENAAVNTYAKRLRDRPAFKRVRGLNIS